jgi:hypothetical protein
MVLDIRQVSASSRALVNFGWGAGRIYCRAIKMSDPASMTAEFPNGPVRTGHDSEDFDA